MSLGWGRDFCVLAYNRVAKQAEHGLVYGKGFIFPAAHSHPKYTEGRNLFA